MSEAQLLDMMRGALWVGMIIALPILTIALITGLAIGLFQALTSVQEMTLTFVPKLAAIMLVFWISMSFSGATLVRFYQDEVIPMVVGR